MSDFLDVLAADAKTTVSNGYYEELTALKPVQNSLRAAIMQAKTTPIIAEVKNASPSRGIIRNEFDPTKISQAMVRGGAAGISVLTEPKHFNGSLSNIMLVRGSVSVPILMKDVVVDSTQIDAASKVAANAVLLIQAVFDRGYCNCTLNEMVAKAHSKNLEVLLETHNMAEFERAAKTQANIIGINNRNLGTLEVDLNVTKNILASCRCKDKVVVSESGINTQTDVRLLRDSGAQGFLIGSAIMLADNVEKKVRELVNA